MFKTVHIKTEYSVRDSTCWLQKGSFKLRSLSFMHTCYLLKATCTKTLYLSSILWTIFLNILQYLKNVAHGRSSRSVLPGETGWNTKSCLVSGNPGCIFALWAKGYATCSI